MIATIGLMVMCVALLLAWLVTANMKDKDMREQREQWMHERMAWKDERQMLLDRIQAPSFAEYTAKVIKEKKAEQPEEPREPVEFVS